MLLKIENTKIPARISQKLWLRIDRQHRQGRPAGGYGEQAGGYLPERSLQKPHRIVLKTPTSGATVLMIPIWVPLRSRWSDNTRSRR